MQGLLAISIRYKTDSFSKEWSNLFYSSNMRIQPERFPVLRNYNPTAIISEYV